jgi:DNA-binding NarL/FixJ family response regulator
MLVALAQSQSKSEIASNFNLAVETVKNRFAHIYKQIGTADRVDAAMFAALYVGVDRRHIGLSR